jgi:hypothetical protein
VKGPFAAGGIRFPQPSFIGLFCAAFLVICLPLRAQSVTSALARSAYSEVHKDAIGAFFAQAGEAGVPAELLLPKLEEGIAKGIPAPRVLEALEREAENLRRSRAVILHSEGGERLLADPAAWARTANLLAVGMREEQVEELIALCGRRIEGFRPATYLYVAAVDWGLAQKPALDLIGALLASPIPPSSYMGVMDLLAGGRRRRISPEEIIQRIRQHLDHATSIKELEKWIY